MQLNFFVLLNGMPKYETTLPEKLSAEWLLYGVMITTVSTKIKDSGHFLQKIQTDIIYHPARLVPICQGAIIFQKKTDAADSP